MITKIDKILSRVASVVSLISYIGIIFIILLIVVDVLMRKFMASNVLGAYEMVERALMCMVFASFAYTQTNRGHVTVTMFVSKAPRLIRFVLLGVVYMISTITAFLVSYAAYVQVGISVKTNTMTAVLMIPYYPFFALESICMLIFGVVLLWDAIKMFLAIGNDAVAEDIQSTWD